MKQKALTRHVQQGGISIVMVVLAIIFGLIVVTGLRVLPVYIEHMSVISSMDSLTKDDALRGVGPNELRDSLMRRLDVNDVDRVTADDVNITRDGDDYIVNVAYDVELPYLSNIALTISFDDSVEVPVR